MRVEWETRQEAAAVATDPELTGLLADAVRDLGLEVEELPSGAGHDAAEVAALTPVAMLFVRCAGGVSHHPDESVCEDDVNVAVEVLERFLHARALQG